MASLAGQTCSTPDMAPWTAVLPSTEDDEAEYLTQVLHLAPEVSEAAIEDELIAKANALGISISRLSPEKRNTSSAESQTSTIATQHVRTFSTASRNSASTTLTSHPSLHAVPVTADTPPHSLVRKRSKSLGFSQYDKYLSQIDPNIDQPKIQKASPSITHGVSTHSLFSVSSRRSYFSIKEGIRKIRRKRTSAMLESTIYCICCRNEFNKSNSLHGLPCGHTYCAECLSIMIQQSTTDESKMPPRCCTQPIPGPIVQKILSREEQHAFLKSVLQFSTPWEARIFCPNTACGEFIPPRNKIDPKHPFDVVCRKCRTRVCVMCKRNAHPVGKDCPSDWELEAVLKMGEKSGWRRCYKCRTLVELSQGCTHMTCRCKAQFCYICGAIWDPSVGCPNFCNGDEELERRRMEEEARNAELEAEKAAQEAAAAAKAAQRIEAEKRTQADAQFTKLQGEMREELDRFRVYTRKMKWAMCTRQAGKKQALADRYSDQIDKMKERHAKTATHLEERQIEAEMDLRSTLDQSEKSVKIRLKHMEAYCDGLGRSSNANLPPRTVTERDLRLLGQQYNVRDGMERLHQAKINVLRDRQAKRMEELLDRQEQELEKLFNKKEQDIENLATDFAHEEDTLVKIINDRKQRLQRRWLIAIEILRKELEEKTGDQYASLALPVWPEDNETQDEILAPLPGSPASEG
ncbi:IBR domain-containing protein [Colletotrichum graminicola]|uniref:RBR-type E3 ubiquitin transferase n=1 Tax=Colletotrichum graminicola (strain M1.001 / M2 / FGSC 10212) TaxID=645133 RepID=E3Q6T6_COLGM|nr:IBR domain-containing protein [Colletotrichum graminicola M1.001]EFQ26574.1 IBR domain-containing protein [Colletotrichum graminicola M1.001]WDK17950.1 IBR domain-containing protein [Colletotrichum graminicola]